MKRKVDGSQIFAFVLGLLFLIVTLTIKPLSELTLTSDAAYPILIAVLSLIFAGWIFVDEKKKTEQKKDDDVSDNFKVLNKDVLIVVGIMAGYAVLLILVHYIISTLIFIVFSITYLYKRNWKTGLLIGFIGTFMIVLVFKYIFSVILP